MAENIGIEEYLHSYLPSLIEKRLAEKPVPEMEGTTFTMQLSIEGEKSMTYGISIRDAREITVTPGGLPDAMFTLAVQEDVIRPVVDLVTSFIKRKQYDTVSNVKGRVDLEIDMTDDWKLPLKMLFNGTDSPQLTLRGNSADLVKIAAGEESAPTAFMQGKIKLDGDLTLGLTLANMFM
jgi:predicted lipid carrier protein YhbT